MHMQQRPGWGNFRLSIRNLPLWYAQFALGSAQTLRTLIADILTIYTYHVATDKKWKSSRDPATWAFLEVGSFEEGAELINIIGRTGDF